MNERVENTEEKKNSPEEKTAGIDLNLQESQRGLGLFPEEKPFTPSLTAQIEGLDSVGREVKDRKTVELEKAKVAFAGELEGLTLKAQVNLDRTAVHTMDSVDLKVDLGEVSASTHLSQASLFQREGSDSFSPEVSFSFKGKELAGSLTFQSEKGQPSILKGEFTTEGFKFKITGSHGGEGGVLVQSTALERTFALEEGSLTLKGEVDFTTGAQKGEVEYRLNF